jgi:hypothetical protein
MIKFYFTSIALFIAISASASNYYVKPAGADANGGANWSLAKKSLQNTINAAAEGDSIFVAAGVYSGGFMMREGITVMGGYTANTAKPRERILPADAANDAQLSILDGGNTQRALTQLVDFATPTVWDGFVIRNGNPANREIAAGYLVYAKDGASIVGVVYAYNATSGNGKMLSVQGIQSSWGGYQTEFSELPCRRVAAADMNGAENTEIIVEKFGETNPDFKNDYKPNGNYAANWCKKLSAGGFSDWYLPSAGEWQEVFAQKNAIYNVLLATSVKLTNGCWTSNHAGDLLAWAFYLENGKPFPVLKHLEKNVCAIHSFQKSELTEITPAEGSVLLQNNGELKNCLVDGASVTYNELGNVSTNFEVFPNPVRQNETITVKTENEIGHLQVTDISGKIIFSKRITGNETSIVAPNPGVYVLRLENGKTCKVVVY